MPANLNPKTPNANPNSATPGAPFAQLSAGAFKGFEGNDAPPARRASDRLWEGNVEVYEAHLNNAAWKKGAAREIRFVKSPSLRRCAQLVKCLSNDEFPGIARYLGSSLVSANELLVLTEYFSEGSLRNWIRLLMEANQGAGFGWAVQPKADDRPVVQPATIRQYSRQLVETVAYLHETFSLTHLRVSASSIFLCDNGRRVKLADLEDAILMQDCTKASSLLLGDRLGIGNVVAEMVTGLVVWPHQQVDLEVPTREECGDEGLFEFLQTLLNGSSSGVLELLHLPFFRDEL